MNEELASHTTLLTKSQRRPSPPLSLALATGIFMLAGCSKNDSAPEAASPGAPKSSATSAATPAAEPALAAWRQGDKSTAVNRFVETDWTTRPLFAPGSLLALSEDQFKQLSAGERQSKSAEIVSAAGELKQLAAAVADRARQAAANKDLPQTRKLFSSVKQCGEALDGPQSLTIVRLVGQAFKKMADTELSKLPQP